MVHIQYLNMNHRKRMIFCDYDGAGWVKEYKADNTNTILCELDLNTWKKYENRKNVIEKLFFN